MSESTLKVPARFLEFYAMGAALACKEDIGFLASYTESFEKAVQEERLLGPESDPRQVAIKKADLEGVQRHLSASSALCSQTCQVLGDDDVVFSASASALTQALETMVREVIHPSMGDALAPSPMGDEGSTEARLYWSAADWALDEMPRLEAECLQQQREAVTV